jgi:hypothetical protein
MPTTSPTKPPILQSVSTWLFKKIHPKAYLWIIQYESGFCGVKFRYGGDDAHHVKTAQAVVAKQQENIRSISVFRWAYGDGAHFVMRVIKTGTGKYANVSNKFKHLEYTKPAPLPLPPYNHEN